MRKIVAGVAFAAAAAMFSMAGLAYAGVSLPSPAVAAFQTAGLTLPNQTGGSSASESSQHGQAVSDAAQDDTTIGCKHGQAVSALARDDHGQGKGPKCDQGAHPTQGATGADAQTAGPQSQPDDNHGQAVSTVAKDGTTGCDHGSEVSAVARDGHGNGNGPECQAGKSGESGGGTSNNPTGNGPSNNPADNGPGNKPVH